MKILGLPQLVTLSDLECSKKWLSAWINEVQSATWRRPSEVIQQFPTAQPVNESRFRFSCSEINGFIEICIAYQQGIVLIVLVEALRESRGL